MMRKAIEARAALKLLKSVSKGRGKEGSKARKGLAAKFRASASELSIRFDTVSAMLPGKDLTWFARYLGCEWRPSSRRLEILDMK